MLDPDAVGNFVDSVSTDAPTVVSTPPQLASIPQPDSTNIPGTRIANPFTMLRHGADIINQVGDATVQQVGRIGANAADIGARVVGAATSNQPFVQAYNSTDPGISSAYEDYVKNAQWSQSQISNLSPEDAKKYNEAGKMIGNIAVGLALPVASGGSIVNMALGNSLTTAASTAFGEYEAGQDVQDTAKSGLHGLALGFVTGAAAGAVAKYADSIAKTGSEILQSFSTKSGNMVNTAKGTASPVLDRFDSDSAAALRVLMRDGVVGKKEVNNPALQDIWNQARNAGIPVTPGVLLQNQKVMKAEAQAGRYIQDLKAQQIHTIESGLNKMTEAADRVNVDDIGEGAQKVFFNIQEKLKAERSTLYEPVMNMTLDNDTLSKLTTMKGYQTAHAELTALAASAKRKEVDNLINDVKKLITPEEEMALAAINNPASMRSIEAHSKQLNQLIKSANVQGGSTNNLIGYTTQKKEFDSLIEAAVPSYKEARFAYRDNLLEEEVLNQSALFKIAEMQPTEIVDFLAKSMRSPRGVKGMADPLEIAALRNKFVEAGPEGERVYTKIFSNAMVKVVDSKRSSGTSFDTVGDWIAATGIPEVRNKIIAALPPSLQNYRIAPILETMHNLAPSFKIEAEKWLPASPGFKSILPDVFGVKNINKAVDYGAGRAFKSGLKSAVESPDLLDQVKASGAEPYGASSIFNPRD